MFISVMYNRDSKVYEWELHNGNYERVDHGSEQSEEDAHKSAEKAKESYLYWLKYYRYRTQSD